MSDKPRKLELMGIVTSNKMNKTVVVTVERLEKHPTFKKYVRKRTTFKAHNEKNDCKIGDKVLIQECRPLSKTKSWRVVSIVETQD